MGKIAWGLRVCVMVYVIMYLAEKGGEGWAPVEMSAAMTDGARGSGLQGRLRA